MHTLNQKHIGNNIKAIRQLRGLKQETFAKKLGIAQQNVSKMENKKEISDKQLEDVAKILETTTKAIKEFDENAIINNNILNEQVNNYNINPIEKVAELFKEILLNRDQEIQRLKDEIEAYKTGRMKTKKPKPETNRPISKSLHSVDSGKQAVK